MTNRFKKSLRRSTFDQGGFTLIELMIVVAVIGILAAIAYPSYQESVAKSRRADAQRALMEADQYMRRYFSAKDTFVGATIDGNMAQSPREGGGSYTINLVEDDVVVDAGDAATEATTYTLRATRTGNMGSDRCGDLSITNTGVKTQTNNVSGTTVAECFKGS